MSRHFQLNPTLYTARTSLPTSVEHWAVLYVTRRTQHTQYTACLRAQIPFQPSNVQYPRGNSPDHLLPLLSLELRTKRSVSGRQEFQVTITPIIFSPVSACAAL